MSLNTTIKRTDYICGIDRITASDVVTTIVYRDGTHKEVEGQSNGVSIELLDENGESAGYFTNRLTKSGKYKVVANVIGMSETCKVNGADITVTPFDPSAATEVQLGEKVSESNTSDVDYTKVYSFTPDEDMDVIFDSSASSVGVYTMTDGSMDYYGGIYVTYSVNAGKTIRDTIIAGTDKELTMSRSDSANLTFVPEVSGVYTIYSYGEDNTDPYVELFRGDDFIGSDDDGSENLHFSLTADLDKGVEYTFVIHVNGSGTFNVLLRQAESDKEISSVRFLDDTFEATRSGSEKYVRVSGYIEVTYDDNSKGTVPYSYGDNYDKYKNVIQGLHDVETIDGKEQAVAQIRYRNKN